MAGDEGKKIVVTGLGVMSGVGNTLDSFWDNLIAGKGSIAKVTRFDVR
jgi:3-oxoacyl-[acyl-carrier-protein] synthase II